MYEFYPDGTWVPCKDSQGCDPAATLWQNSERAAYVAYQCPVTVAFVFGSGGTTNICWAIPEKPVCAIKVFNEYSSAQEWAQTIYKLTHSVK